MDVIALVAWRRFYCALARGCCWVHSGSFQLLPNKGARERNEAVALAVI